LLNTLKLYNREIKMEVQSTIPGMQSYEECKKSIEFYANTIKNSDDTSISVNRARLLSLKTVIELYEKYLDIIENDENSEEQRIYNIVFKRL
jgi:hypothetical protein